MFECCVAVRLRLFTGLHVPRFFSQLFDTSLDAATQMLSDTTSADNAATQPTDNDGFTLPLAVSAQAQSSKVKN